MTSNTAIWLEEIFRDFGAVTARAMFGGYGVYHQGLMFALVADEVIYLKVDADIEATFRERGLQPFTYEKKGKAMQMSYWQAPDEIYDDPEEAVLWARRSYEAALRARR